MLATFPPSEAQCCCGSAASARGNIQHGHGGAFWSWTGPHFERAATQSFWLPPTLTPYQEPWLSLKLHQTGKNKNQPREKESEQLQTGPPSLKSTRERPLWHQCQWLTRARSSKAEVHPSDHLSIQGSWARSKALGSAEWTEPPMLPPMSHVTLETLLTIFVGSSIKWG